MGEGVKGLDAWALCGTKLAWPVGNTLFTLFTLTVIAVAAAATPPTLVWRRDLLASIPPPPSLSLSTPLSLSLLLFLARPLSEPLGCFAGNKKII